jgi:hypothetical protein
MSPTQTSTLAKPGIPGRTRLRKAMGAATLALMLGAGTAAAPAQATSTATAPPCAVTAAMPYASGESSSSGKKLIIYPIKVSCWETGATVHLRQKLMEADNPPNLDDIQKNWFDPVPGPLASKVGTQTLNTKHPLRDMDGIGKSEVYHVVKFRVVDRHGVSSKVITVSSLERSIHP